jgi:hypothetical protein
MRRLTWCGNSHPRISTTSAIQKIFTPRDASRCGIASRESTLSLVDDDDRLLSRCAGGRSRRCDAGKVREFVTRYFPELCAALQAASPRAGKGATILYDQFRNGFAHLRAPKVHFAIAEDHELDGDWPMCDRNRYASWRCDQCGPTRRKLVFLMRSGA